MFYKKEKGNERRKAHLQSTRDIFVVYVEESQRMLQKCLNYSVDIFKWNIKYNYIFSIERSRIAKQLTCPVNLLE